MTKNDTGCVDCGFPCLGKDCPYSKIKTYYCDDCGAEHDYIYEFEGKEMCIYCIEKSLTRVGNGR